MNGFQRFLFWSSSLLTGVTGLVYFWMKYFMEPSEPWAVINHPLQPLVLKAHILVAPVLVFVLGMITPEHIWKRFRAPQPWNRRSGVLTMAVLLPMILSGYLIQAVTHTGWLSVFTWSHVITGVVYLLGMGLHGGIPGRSRVRSRPGEDDPDSALLRIGALRVPRLSRAGRPRRRLAGSGS